MTKTQSKTATGHPTGNPDWVVLDGPLRRKALPIGVPKSRGTGAVWQVQCVHCHTEQVVTTVEYNKGSYRCACGVSTFGVASRTRATLTIFGVTKSLSEWAKTHHIPINSIRKRYYDRKRGAEMYTDTEVLFGIAEVKRTDSDMERKMSAEFDRLTLMNTLDNLLEGYITRAVARREMHKVEVSTLEAKVAGAGYTLLTGVSIEDLQVAGVTLEAVEGMLDDEVFMSIEEKHEKLDPYIVYVDETSARLEPVEIMQLLSVAKHTRK